MNKIVEFIFSVIISFFVYLFWAIVFWISNIRDNYRYYFKND